MPGIQKKKWIQDSTDDGSAPDQDMENNSTQKLSSTKLGEILQSMKEFFLVDLQSSFNKTSQEKEAKDQIKITPSFNKEKLEADLLFFKEYLIGNFLNTFNNSDSKNTSLKSSVNVEEKDTLDDSFQSFKEFLFGDLQSSLTLSDIWNDQIDDESKTESDEIWQDADYDTQESISSDELPAPLLSFTNTNIENNEENV